MQDNFDKNIFAQNSGSPAFTASIQNIEASLLATILHTENSNLFLRSYEQLAVDDFSSRFHQEIYRFLEFIVVQKSLKIEKSFILGKLKNAKQRAHFDIILSTGYSLENFDTYIKEVKKDSRDRKFRFLIQEMLVRSTEENFDTLQAIGQLEDSLLKIVSNNQYEMTPIGDVGDQIMAQIQNGRVMSKARFRIDTINDLTNGLEPGYICLAARPAIGKTACILDTALYNAKDLSNRVLLFSLEMDRMSLVKRLLSTLSKIPHFALRRDTINAEDIIRLKQAVEILRKLPLHIDDSPGLSSKEICARAKRFKIKYPDLALIGIDYIQLMKGMDGNMEHAVSIVSSDMKSLSRAMGIPIVVLAQLNRSCELREDKRPILNDLRNSGSLEADADLVVMLYSDDAYDEARKSSSIWITEFLVRKNRNGPIGTVTVQNLKDFQTFVDIEGLYVPNNMEMSTNNKQNILN